MDRRYDESDDDDDNSNDNHDDHDDDDSDDSHDDDDSDDNHDDDDSDDSHDNGDSNNDSHITMMKMIVQYSIYLFYYIRTVSSTGTGFRCTIVKHSIYWYIIG